MQKTQYVPMVLISVAILAGCATPKNEALIVAHSNYNNASISPRVTTQAALELKEASDALSKADQALNKGESTSTVNHLVYLANRKIEIAEETSRRKTAELAIANASNERNQVRLEARTAEADAAKQQVVIAQKQVAVVQETVNQQAEQLAAANANAERDQQVIADQEMQLKELNAKKTKRGLVITLGDVLFSTSKAQLNAGGNHSVQKLADFLSRHPKHRVLIEGHTDSTGSVRLNKKLSMRRANAVQLALIGMGINSERIVTHGYGKEFPVASNDTAADRQLNRRVEIILSDDNGTLSSR